MHTRKTYYWGVYVAADGRDRPKERETMKEEATKADRSKGRIRKKRMETRAKKNGRRY